MKKYFMCFILFIFIVSTFITPVFADTTEYKYINVGNEKLQVKNRKIVDSDNNEFVMNGIAIAQVFGLNFKTERYSLETFRLLREAGFNSIRFQLTSELFYNYTTKEWNQTNIDILKDLMKNAEDAGIYIIVDMHGVKNGDPNSFDDTEGKEYCFINEEGHPWTEEFYTVWEKIVTTVKDYKSLLAYELLNEPQACFKTEEQAVLDYYSNFLQTLVNKIRAIDKDTIISFQPIHNYRKYNDTSYYPYASPVITKFPSVDGDNFLVDSKHEYNSQIYSQTYRVINMTEASEVEQEASQYHGYNTPGISKYTNLTDNMTISQEITCDDPENDCRTTWFVASFNNMNGGTVKANSIKIYQIDADGTSHVAFEAASDSDPVKLMFFKLQSGTVDLFKTINVSSNRGQYFADPISNLHVGIPKGGKIKIELNIDITGYTASSGIEFEYSLKRVKPNKRGYALVQAKDKLEDYFANLDEISAGYGSPLYFGEFCVIADYINDYSKDRDYTNDFYDLAKKYHLNWIWHRMSEYPADNGFGAYINGITPTVENRRPSQWAYDIPKLLSLPGEYKGIQDESTKTTEKVQNPKTGLTDYLIIGIPAILIGVFIIRKIILRDKFVIDL